MKTFTALLHKGEPDEGGFWATCLEVPGANGQGDTKEECLDDLGSAIKLILAYNREQATAEDPETTEAELSLA